MEIGDYLGVRNYVRITVFFFCSFFYTIYTTYIRYIFARKKGTVLAGGLSQPPSLRVLFTYEQSLGWRESMSVHRLTSSLKLRKMLPHRVR